MRRFQGPYWITANHVTEKLCVADWDARSVTCMTSDGDVTFIYTSASLSRPQAVLSDDCDNLIIADWDNMNMSLVMRKSVFGVSDQVRHKPGSKATEDG